MIGPKDVTAAPILSVSPAATAAELAAILAVLSRRTPEALGASPAATPWRDAARRAAVHQELLPPMASGWARAARRSMQHAGHG
ncbi:MAG TPA: hypothetical protein VMU89_00460 [Thermomicrobiaceae bacterium]|nr:hypothetical protein [Thermomicrobiaceae bacterium]